MIETDKLVAVDRLIAPNSKSAQEEAQERALRPKRLADYTGQVKIREQLEIFIQAARNRSESLDHVLLFGPPLIWGGAAAWLYNQGETGWAIFLVLYGLFVISSIDNFLKPILMARGAGISILLIALGVIGGILVFGFIGIFLGPVLLALGHMLLGRWTREEEQPA